MSKELDETRAGLRRRFPDEEAVDAVVRSPYWTEIGHEDRAHIVRCCDALVRFYTGEVPYLGDFLTAVVKNDLMEAFRRADDANTKYMWCYCAFIYNEIPLPLVGWGRTQKR